MFGGPFHLIDSREVGHAGILIVNILWPLLYMKSRLTKFGNYLQTPTDYRHTDNDLREVMVVHLDAGMVLPQ